MNYITQTELEHYIGSTLTGNGVNMFNLMLPAMQDMIDQYTNRSWNFSNPVTETLDAYSITGGQMLPVYSFAVKYPQISETAANNAYPLAGGIISVKVGGQLIDMNYVFNYGTTIKMSGQLGATLLTNAFGYKMVEIVYNSAGAGAPPTPIKQALTEWLARKIQISSDSNKESSLVTVGTVEARYIADKVGGIPDFVRIVLNQYRLPPIDRF